MHCLKFSALPIHTVHSFMLLISYAIHSHFLLGLDKILFTSNDLGRSDSWFKLAYKALYHVLKMKKMLSNVNKYYI